MAQNGVHGPVSQVSQIGALDDAPSKSFNSYLSGIKTTIFSVMTQLSQVSQMRPCGCQCHMLANAHCF
jgi:hypothetical protein